jgi:hypothetical protein
VAGSNREDYLVQGYAESEDGKSGWSTHALFAPTEMRMFDFCVSQRGDAFDAIFARVWVKEDKPPPQTGSWWCRAKTPSSRLSDWGQPIQIMTAEDRGWHSGPWKPSLQFHEQIGERALIFFDGSYRASDPVSTSNNVIERAGSFKPAARFRTWTGVRTVLSLHAAVAGVSFSEQRSL